MSQDQNVHYLFDEDYHPLRDVHLEVVMHIIEHGDLEQLNPWALEFLESLNNMRGPLTQKQWAALADITAKMQHSREKEQIISRLRKGDRP